MKGTTLTGLNDAYERQSDAIAAKTILVKQLGFDGVIGEVGYVKSKLIPRGKVFSKLINLCGQAEIYD
ncbi:TPA: hypothetical protein VEO38_002019 [Providencia alcalifaciens]|nr:hypothetical protein [Providencia alcalifaciens]